MATLDWDGLVFYDQQIKKHIDKILDKYASKTYVADEIAKATTGIDLTIYAKTSDVDAKLNNYVKKTDAFSGDYNDLNNKPDITSLATKTYVNDEIAKVSTGGVDLTGYAKTSDVDAKLNNYVKKTDAFSGDYNDLNNKPTIPDVTNLATKVELNNYVNKTDAFSGSYNDLADKPTIPNVTGKADKTYVDTELAKKANKSELFSGSYNDLADKPTIPNVTGKADKTYVDTELANKANKSELFSGSYNDLTDKPNIPNVSNLATKTELNNHVGSTKHITDDERTKWNGYNDTINTMKTNFEDGVNTIYNAVVAKGVTPLDKSPSNVAKAIESLVIKEKGQLLLTCKSSRSDELPAPKFNNDNSYNYTCEDIDNGDRTFTRNIYGTKEINQICFYEDKNSENWLKSLEYTTNVKLVSAENMFCSCQRLKSVNLNNIDTSECENFNSMFKYCGYLTSLDVSKFNTSQVTNMSYMFEHCDRLTSLDLSNFNTSKVTDMYAMFNNCTSLQSLDIRNFSSENLADCNNMFQNVPSTCTVYVDKTKFTKTEAECGFTGTFTDVSMQG